MSTKIILKSAVAFFFLFFLHGISIGNGQQGISYNKHISAVRRIGALREYTVRRYAITFQNTTTWKIN